MNGREPLVRAEGGENEEAKGEENESSGKQVVAVAASMIACMGSMSFGWGQGFTAPAEKSIESDDPARCTSLCLSEEKWSTFTGAVNIGAVIGAVMGGPLSDRLGRKLSLVAASLPLLIGWVLQGLASGFAGLMTGRIAVGFGIGIVSCVVPMYIAEIAPTQIRGALGSLHEMGIMSGILTVYGLGTDAVPFGWRGLSFTGVVPAAALLIGMFFVPETPHWLITQGAYNDAEVALKRLRMSNNVQDEIREVYEAYLEDTANDETRLHELVDKVHRPALVAAVGLMFVQQLSGVNAIIGFSDQILLDAGLPDADLAAVLVAGFQAFATFLAVLLMDRAGRRPLLFVSCAGMAASASLLAFSFLFRQSLGTFRGLLATLGTAVFVISYALGLGAIPWIIQGEIFSSRAKGIGSSVAVFVNWGMAAVITGTYESGEAMIHDYGMFFLYAGFLVLGIVFTAMFVPETKGKSLEEIQHSLSRSIVA